MTIQTPTTIDSLLPHGEAVRAGRAAKAQAGIPTGPVPLGYGKTRANGSVRVEVDEEVAPLVREAFRLAGLRRQPLRNVVDRMTAEGLRSQRGIPLSPTALWRILTNPFYCGTIRYGDQFIPGTHTPLVSASVFEKVNGALNERRRH